MTEAFFFFNEVTLGGPLDQESPTTGPGTGTGPWPVRIRAAPQEVSCGPDSKASSEFSATPQH